MKIINKVEVVYKNVDSPLVAESQNCATVVDESFIVEYIHS